MPRERNTLVVLEHPWDEDDGLIADYSMRPFVEGLAELEGWRLVYRTFTGKDELKRLLEGEAFDRIGKRAIVYVSSHGSGGRLQLGREGASSVNLATVGRSLMKDVEGVWLGACDVGGGSLQAFLGGGGAIWAGGYKCAMDWDACMLIDCAVLRGVMKADPIRDRQYAYETFLDAFERFSPAWTVGVDEDDEEVSLKDALRVIARDKGRGSVEDLTKDLLDELGW